MAGETPTGNDPEEGGGMVSAFILGASIEIPQYCLERKCPHLSVDDTTNYLGMNRQAEHEQLSLWGQPAKLMPRPAREKIVQSLRLKAHAVGPVACRAGCIFERTQRNLDNRGEV